MHILVLNFTSYERLAFTVIVWSTNFVIDIGTTNSFGGGGGSGGGGGFTKKAAKRKNSGSKPKLLMSSLKQGRRALAARSKAPVNIHSSIQSQGDNLFYL